MPTTEIVKTETLDPGQFFAPGSGAVDEVLARVREHTEKIIEDPNTIEGRKAIVTMAREVSSLKAAIEKKGREELKRLKASVKPIEANVRAWVQGMDSIRDDARRPVTEIEDAERAEAERQREKAAEEERKRQEDLDRREKELKEAEAKLKRQQDAIKQQQEAKRMAEAQAKEAKKRAEQEAKLKAQRVKEAADRKLRQAQVAEQRAKLAAVEAEEKARAEKVLAEQRAEAEKQAAIEAERERIRIEAEERAAVEALEAEVVRRRQEDIEHREQVKREASEDLGACLGVSAASVATIIALIERGQIRHITLNF